MLREKPPFQQHTRFRIMIPAHGFELLRGDFFLNDGKVVHDFMNYIRLQRLENLKLLCFIERVVKRVLIEQLHPQQSVIEGRRGDRIIGNDRGERTCGRLEKAVCEIPGVYSSNFCLKKDWRREEAMCIRCKNTDNSFMDADPVNLFHHRK